MKAGSYTIMLATGYRGESTEHVCANSDQVEASSKKMVLLSSSRCDFKSVVYYELLQPNETITRRSIAFSWTN